MLGSQKLKKLFKQNFVVFASIFVICHSSISLAGSQVSNVRLWQAPDHTRIVFDLNSPVEHQIFSLEGPHRLVVDLKDVQVNANVATLDLSSSPITNIRAAKKDKQDFRMVFDLSKKLKPQSFVLPPNAKYGHRLVIDLYDKNRQIIKTEKTAKPVPKKRSRTVIVAIDAGHGGEDPGAIGAKGTKEKKVVLEIAKELYKSLKKTRGMKPVLTRTGDYYLSLSTRPKLAKKKHNADIFISIHADAFKTPQAKGMSVFALSRDGATSSTASYLAEKENESDLIGGVRIDEKDSMVRNVIVDLIMEGSLEHSIYMGDKILGQMGGVGKLHKKQVEQAGFRVLKSPDMLSILVETGFISNPTEEKRLRSKAYQRKIATAITKGLESYLNQYPIPGTYYAKNQTKRYHVIRSGETLSGIAAKYGVSLTALKKANSSKGDKIKTGQKLVIP